MSQSAGSPPFGLFERMLAGRYLRAKRQYGGVALISVISVIAITLAVMALIITMSVMNGFRETLLTRILGVNGHVFVDVRTMPGDEVERLRRLIEEAPDVVHVTPIINAQALASAEGLAAGVLVRGIPRAELEGLPIVVLPNASYAYATAYREQGDRNAALAAARKAWDENEYTGRGEETDPYHRLAFRGSDPLDREFAALAEEVFAPLLAHQEAV